MKTFIKKLCRSLVLLSLLVHAVGCSSADAVTGAQAQTDSSVLSPTIPGITEIKFLALNPAQYVEKKVVIEGHIRGVSPGEAWFILEDAGGKMLVTTHDIGLPLYCPSGARARVRGKLRDLGSDHGLYFSMSAIKSCTDESRPLTAVVGAALRWGFAWALSDGPGMMPL